MEDTTNVSITDPTHPNFDFSVLGPILSVVIQMLLERLYNLEISHQELKSQVKGDS